MISLATSLALLSTWGYFLLFPLSILEGPIIGVFAGFLVSLDQMNWFVAFLVLFLGDMVGDVIYYYIGRWGHGPWADRLAARFKVTPESLRTFEEKFREHDVKILLINKAQALGSVTLYYAGALRMPLMRFIWINVVGTIPKVALFEIIGYYFGASYKQIDGYLYYAGIATLAIPIVLLAGYFLFKYYYREQEKKED